MSNPREDNDLNADREPNTKTGLREPNTKTDAELADDPREPNTGSVREPNTRSD